MATLIEPFIFNRVSADIKRFIAEEQGQAIKDDACHFVPDDDVPREDFYEDLHVHFSFLDSLLTVRFNEHASLDKAANLGISQYIRGYASLFNRMEEKAPQLFNIEEGYVVANTKEGEAYFESLAYKDIEDVVENVRGHLLALEDEYLQDGQEGDGKLCRALAKTLNSVQRYAHAKSGIAIEPYPHFKPKRDVDYSFV